MKLPVTLYEAEAETFQRKRRQAGRQKKQK